MNNKENFEIKLRIKDKDGKIINLNQKVDLEVNWERKGAKVPQEVVFKKDGEEYRIIITKLEIWKGLFKKKKGSFSWKEPPGASYRFYHGEPSSDRESKTSSKDEEDDYYIRLTNPWRTEVIISFLTAVTIAIISILFLWSWWRKKKKGNMLNTSR